MRALPQHSTGSSTGRQVGAVLAAVISLGATLWAFATFTSAVRWVEHTLEVKQALSEWLGAIVDGKSGERGYIIAQRPEFLVAYERALASVHPGAARVRQLTADNPAQQSNIDAAEELAVTCAEGMRRGIALVDSGHRDEATQLVAGGVGEEQVSSLRRAVAGMQAEEDRLLVSRARTERERGGLALGAVAFFSAFAAYLLFATWAARREAKDAQRVAAVQSELAQSERAAASHRAQTQLFQESFMAVLGHDLRNPLNSISMALELLLRNDLPPDVASRIRRAKTASDRMRRMIDQILDFTRARLAGGIPISPRAMNIGDLVQEVTGECRLAFPDRALVVERDGDLAGEWDGDRLAQVISNLLGNALTHGADGAPVSVSIRGTAGSVEIRVSNDGEIPEDVRETLFDPFRRAGRETKSSGAAGLGLGLFIAEQIVRHHGGSLVAESAAGRTTFLVRLPRDVAAALSERRRSEKDASLGRQRAASPAGEMR